MWKVSNTLPASFPDMEASCNKVGYLPLHSVDFRILRSFQLAHRNKFVSGLKSQFFEELFVIFSSTGFRLKKECDSSRSPARRQRNAGKIESSTCYLVQWAAESDPTRNLSAWQRVCPG